MKLDYSVVIATFQRPQPLEKALASLASQTHPPASVIVVDGAPEQSARAVVERFSARLRIEYLTASRSSAAIQRNLGAERVHTPLIAFMDDDAEAFPHCFEKMCEPFTRDAEGKIGGVSGRLDGMTHPRPRGLLWLYYRLQAGYSDATYGGRLFGAAINCVPCYEEQTGPLIESQWLGSTCVMFRTEIFQREKFPAFDGYSFMEDVHLSARIAKTHRLFYHCDAVFLHHDQPSTFKRDTKGMARMRLRNQRLVARDVLKVPPMTLGMKMFVARLFHTATILRSRNAGWWPALVGTWT